MLKTSQSDWIYDQIFSKSFKIKKDKNLDVHSFSVSKNPNDI